MSNAWALAVLLLVGCAPKQERRRDPLMQALAAADRVWADRAAVGIDTAEMAYTSLLARWPGEPEVWGRLAGTAWSRAMLSPEQARAWHEAGREQAMRCLLRDRRLESAVLLRGDRLDADVLLGIKRRDGSCLVYAAAHTVMLVRARGEGAMLDLADVGPLVAHAAGLDDVEPALRRWAEGSALVMAGDDPLAARALLAEAVTLAPGQLFFVLEAERAFPDLAGSWSGVPPDPVWKTENAALEAARVSAGGR